MATEANDAVSPELSTTASSPTTSAVAGGGDGVVVSITDELRSFLTSSSTDSHLSEDLRDLSSSLTIQSTVPYKSLKSIWLGSKPGVRPDLSSLLAGSNFVFTSPTPRQKSEELMVRLRKLEEAAERKAYNELVKDITPKKSVEEPFSSYKDQLGFVNFGSCGEVTSLYEISPASKVPFFTYDVSLLIGIHSKSRKALFRSPKGLHVVVTMFTGYLVGFAAFRALFSKNPAMSAAGGILGLVVAMLVETLLFIFKSSDLGGQPPSSTSRPPNLRIKKNL